MGPVLGVTSSSLTLSTGGRGLASRRSLSQEGEFLQGRGYMEGVLEQRQKQGDLCMRLLELKEY